MTNKTTLPTSVRKFNAAVKRVAKQIEAFAQGTDIDTLEILGVIGRLESGRKSPGHAIAAEFGYSSPEMSAAYAQVADLRLAASVALESAIVNRRAARAAEIRALDAEIVAARRVGWYGDK